MDPFLIGLYGAKQICLPNPENPLVENRNNTFLEKKERKY